MASTALASTRSRRWTAGGSCSGATGGYLVGFLVASAVVGGLAERGWDRRPLRSLAAMVIGTAIIYAFGVAWLAHRGEPLAVGRAALRPLAVPARRRLEARRGRALLPLGWRLVSRRASGTRGGTAGPA